MRADLLKLGEWLRRIGVQRYGWSPELAEIVQPVQVVSDVSVLVPPLLPPSASSGGQFTSNVARTWCGQLQCLAPHGAFLRGCRITNANAGALGFEFGVTQTPYTFVGIQPGINRNFGPAPVSSIWTIGDTAGPVFAATEATIIVPGNTTIVLDDLFFVPPGSFFQVEVNGVAVATVYSALTWQEV